MSDMGSMSLEELEEVTHLVCTELARRSEPPKGDLVEADTVTLLTYIALAQEVRVSYMMSTLREAMEAHRAEHHQDEEEPN